MGKLIIIGSVFAFLFIVYQIIKFFSDPENYK